MPRLKIKANEYAIADFRKELFRCLADRYENVTVRALALELGVCQATLNTKIRNKTDQMDIGELQMIVPLLKPDPEVILKLVGYTCKEIARFKNT